MSVAQLIQSDSTVTPLDVNNPVYINPISGVLTFAAFGSGTDTWSATITIVAVHSAALGMSTQGIADASTMTITISNTQPANSTSVITAHRYYSAYISALSGTVSVYATVEG